MMAKPNKPAKVNPRSNGKSKPKVERDSNTKGNSPYVFQRDKIDFELRIRELPWTEKQKQIIDLILNKNTKIVFIKGPAGTSKTITSAYCALKLLNEKRISDIVYVRTVIESASRSLGYIKGDQSQKMEPYTAPIASKLEELIGIPTTNKLLNEERVKSTPVNYLRGASFNTTCLIADEVQNMQISEIQTVISRIGNFSKFIFCGDPMQSDLKGNEKSGFMPAYDMFNNEESRQNGIHCIELGKEDIVRSEILKFIVEKFENYALHEKIEHDKKKSQILLEKKQEVLPSEEWRPAI